MSQPKTYIYTIDRFETMDNTTERELLPKNTAYYAGNLRYDETYHAITKRLSRSKYNAASITTNYIPFVYRFYKNSTNSAALLVGVDSKIMIGYDGLGIFSTLKTGFASNTWSPITYKNLCYMFNGEDANQVYTMATGILSMANMGVPSAGMASGTVSAAAGNLSGTLYWAISYQFDGYQEGNIGPSSTGVVCTASRATVSLTTSTDSRCTARYLYRTKSNTTTMYRVATISGNSTVTYIDNIADSSLDTTKTAPIDYNSPDSYRFACLHKERLFLGWNKTYNSRIIFADIRDGTSYPDVFPTNNYFNIAQDDGDEITFVKNDQLNQLIISKKNSIRILYTSADSPLAWLLSDSFSTQGCIAPYTAATTPLGIMYLSRFGENKKRLVLWTGNGVQLIPQLEGIVGTLSAIPDTFLERIVGHYNNGFYYLSYRDPTGGELYNNRVMIIDIFRNFSISIDKKNVSSFASLGGGNDWGELYTGTSDNTGYIRREDVTSFDLMIRYLSELNTGTNSFTSTSGSENYPSLGLTATISGVGGATWSTAGIWSQYTGAFDTWWLNGEWVDTIREISAKALLNLFWHDIDSDSATVGLYIRTGDTNAACQAAAWNGPYWSGTGEDISSVTPGKYVQIKAKLFTKYVSNYNEVYLTREGIEAYDYVIKLSSNYGTADETTIELDWKSGRIDLGDVNEVIKRLRKRLRSVKIEFDRTSSVDGGFDFLYYLDGADSPTGSFNTSYTTYSNTRTYQFPLDKCYCNDFVYRLWSDYDIGDLTIRKVIFTVSTEPYYVHK